MLHTRAAALVESQEALAQGGELGLLEGRSVALLHPLAEAGLLAATLYTGYLGYQWKQASHSLAMRRPL